MNIKYGISPFIPKVKNNLKGFKLIIINAFIESNSEKPPKIKSTLSTQFVEMVNIIHFGLSLKSPIILEGLIGQGKQTAIKYISELLGFKILNIQLSSSNKEEDLLGKVIVDKDKETNSTIIKLNETDLLKIKTKEKYLIVFNDLKNANDAVKEKIAKNCDRYQKDILLQDGNTQSKPLDLYIICVINLQCKSDIRSKLPSLLLYSTIYYKVGDLSPEDIKFTTLSIFYKYFGKDGIKEEEDFIEKYNKVNNILIENKSSKLLAFNDINNYTKLRAVTKNIFDKSVIDNMIFYYRTQEKENLLKIKKS